MKKIYQYSDIMIIWIVFLQYRYIGDSFKTIPRCHDVILPVSWNIVISEFYCSGDKGFQTSNSTDSDTGLFAYLFTMFFPAKFFINVPRHSWEVTRDITVFSMEIGVDEWLALLLMLYAELISMNLVLEE